MQLDAHNTAVSQRPALPELPTAEKFRQFIETEVLKIIKKLAEEGKTSSDRIQAIAQNTLTLIKPDMTLDLLYASAVKLDDNYSELAPVVYAVMKEYEEKYEKAALGVVSAMIRNKQYDQAQAMVKKVLSFKIYN